MNTESHRELYIVLISVHGLIRGHNLELGRDSDTGGQTKYVVELARALAEHPSVSRVDLLTRAVTDSKVSSDYSEPVEPLAPNAHIIRLPFGPRRYLRKEVLWHYLDSMADQALHHIRRVGRVPDVIHSHYADAGYVGGLLASLLGVPLLHTGHSLGREKRRRLLDQGVKANVIENQYSMTRRIEAEEFAMDHANLVIASTRQEVEQQYSLYDNYHPKRMRVLPPGTDLARFHPARRNAPQPPIKQQLDRFLKVPKKPIILALSRPDERKNIRTLVQAYGENPQLQKLANLVVVAGNRDDIEALDKGARRVLTELLLMVDRYDLYGKIAYPKHHGAADVPDLYRLAATSGGIFINPALTEPFGLTLIEAAASGVPIVATEDGGPRDIIGSLKNGLLVDPLDADAMGEALVTALQDRNRWQRWARNGVDGASRRYSWQSHAAGYIKEVRKLLGKRHRARIVRPTKSRLPTISRLVVCDVDNTLLGDQEAVDALMEQLHAAGERVGFAVATGRRRESALRVLKQWGIPTPDLLIASVGTEIYYGKQLVMDQAWQRHIDYQWERERLRQAVRGIPGIRQQPTAQQTAYKLSYFINPDKAPPIRDIVRYLRGRDLHTHVSYSHEAYLDLLPIRACKGHAVRYLGARWGIKPEAMLVAGDSGNDVEMLRGDTLGVVVGNHSGELSHLRGEPKIYFADGEYAWGVLEGLDYYNFLNPNDTAQQQDDHNVLVGREPVMG